jgi:hypothetical protein
MTASELAALVARTRAEYSSPAKWLRDTATFLWLLSGLFVIGLALNYGLGFGSRLKGHCNDLARPRLHIECAQGSEAEAGQGAVRSRHAVQDARGPGGGA